MNSLHTTQENGTSRIFVNGVWDKKSVVKFEKKPFLKPECKSVVFDFSKLANIDTAGIVFFLGFEKELKKQGYSIAREYLNERNSSLFALCEKNYTENLHFEPKRLYRTRFFIGIGERVMLAFKALRRFITFSGMIFVALFDIVRKPHEFRFIAFLYHIEHCALRALPIIILTSLLVGVVLTYQAAYQLAQFGANIFIVDLVGISATREIAPLIAAIVIAGRSASSYTAQIGVMKITDEINAMNTMGFSSARFIILPRVLALTFSMPLIVAVADATSIAGGMIVADLSLGVNWAEFMKRFQEAVALKHIIIGIIKAPAFGFIIGSIACFRGFGVKNTTESIGIYTTKSVVNAIFWVIAFDALFSIFLTQADI